MEFLKVLLDGVPLDDNIKMDQLKKLYYQMSPEEQDMMLHNIKGCVGDDVSEGIYLLTYLLYLIKDEKVIKIIYDIINSRNIDSLSVLNYIYQIGSYVFSNTIANNEGYSRRFFYEDEAYTAAVNDVIKHIHEEKLKYIPYERRNRKKVIITARSILAESHAPTMIMCNLYNYLQQLGYDVIILVGYMGKVQEEKRNDVYNYAVDNTLVETTQLFQTDHYGLCVNVCNIAFTTQGFYQELAMAVDYVRGVNPEFIIDVGGMNIIADVCSKFTTVCSYPCVGTPVHSAAHVVIRCFHSEGEEERLYNSFLSENQRVYELVTANELCATGNADNNDIMSKSGSKFVILVVGNRLDSEVSQEFMDVLNLVLDDEPDVYVEFIGKCDKLQHSLKTHRNSGRYIFKGFVKNLQNEMLAGDLFVNPQRRGGGTSAMLAIKNRTPVVTLGNCDVALWGEGFVCAKLQQYPEIIKRYIHDEEFMKAQKAYCVEQDKLFNHVDSVGNVKRFCEQLRKYILTEESYGTDSVQ